MRFETNALIAAALLTASQTTASVIPRRSGSSESVDACGQIYQLFAKIGNATEFTVPGELGLACLQALPFDSKRAVEFVKEYRKWLLFQSDLEILKNPPADYQMPATDLIGTLDDIAEKAANNEYSSQYEFDTALDNMVRSAYDGPMALGLCSSRIMAFENDTPLVSISTNGTALPEVYTFSDAEILSSHKNQVSPIVSIDGIDVTTFLEQTSLLDSSQDRDTLWNDVFKSNPRSLGGAKGHSWEVNGFFATPLVWTGPYHTLHYKNATSQVLDTLAVPQFVPRKSAQALWEAACIPNSNSTSTSSKRSLHSPLKAPLKSLPEGSKSRSKRSSAVSAPEGYPSPSSRTTDNSLLSFFPDSTNLADVGVLALPSFEPADILDWSNLAQEFIESAVKQNKKKIIIDLQGNGGGVVTAGFNLFRMFFPDEDIFFSARFRASEGSKLLTKAVDTQPASEMAEMPFSWNGNVKPDQTDGFSSWEDFFGPDLTLGMNSSSLFSYNMTSLSSVADEQPISGYGEVPLSPKTQHWDAEDIVLLTDGICASTCTLFTELMKGQGVRTIAFGGRPQLAPMQGMGGIKGASVVNLVTYSAALQAIQGFRKNSTLTTDELAQWDQYIPKGTTEWPLYVSSASINMLNSYGPSNDQVPRQYIYEAAECRRFFTRDNVFDQETTWASAADAMFDNGPCVEGSTNGTGSLFANVPSHSRNQRLLAMIIEATTPK